MGASEYVLSLREHVGHELLLLPGVSAVVFDERGRVLLGSAVPSLRWSLIGGAIEPEESPREALLREIAEELGAEAEILSLVGVYGGPQHTARYDNGDVVSYVVSVFLVRLTTPIGALQADELAAVDWFSLEELAALNRSEWLDAVVADAADAARAQARQKD